MKLPIIFHRKYDIGLFGLENLHPFDSKKYGKVFRFLEEKEIIVGDNYFEPEEKASNETLLGVHTQEYLDSLKQSANEAKIAELGFLKMMPNFILQSNFLNPMRWATAGTILAAEFGRKAKNVIQRGLMMNWQEICERPALQILGLDHHSGH